jgi:hypothetical protein
MNALHRPRSDRPASDRGRQHDSPPASGHRPTGHRPEAQPPGRRPHHQCPRPAHPPHLSPLLHADQPSSSPIADRNEGEAGRTSPACAEAESPMPSKRFVESCSGRWEAARSGGPDGASVSGSLRVWSCRLALLRDLRSGFGIVAKPLRERSYGSRSSAGGCRRDRAGTGPSGPRPRESEHRPLAGELADAAEPFDAGDLADHRGGT